MKMKFPNASHFKSDFQNTLFCIKTTKDVKPAGLDQTTKRCDFAAAPSVLNILQWCWQTRIKWTLWKSAQDCLAEKSNVFAFFDYRIKNNIQIKSVR